mgnify:CR=1 FL=1
MSQQIKCIRIQVDCRIHSKIPEPNAARFGQPLIVECLFNCQARLHQHQSKIKLSHINRSANVSTKSQDPFLRRQFPERVKLRFPFGSGAKSQSEVQHHVKFIVELVSEGARNAPTIFQTFSSTVAFTSGAQSARASPLPVFANQTNATMKNSPKKQVHG